jgi:TRAP-type C4-dicarboxylate transport system permease small subunit
MGLWGRIECYTLASVKGLSYAAGIILAGMMVLIISDVLMRYVFAKPIHGVLEITEEILMIAVVFLTLASAPHIRVTFITERFRPEVRARIRVISLIPVILFFVIVDWKSLLQAAFSFSKGETSWGLIPFPLYPSRFVVFLGFTFLTLRLLIRLMDTLRGKED